MKVVFAGGSTGGHLMTGLSVAQKIKSECPESEMVFFATSKPFEKQAILEKGFFFKRLKFTTSNRKTTLQKIKFSIGILLDTIYAGFIINRCKPDIIIGLGGYSSVPPILAGTLLFLPFILIEQNLIPGKVNRIFSRRASEVYCHFIQSKKWFNRAKLVVDTGNPIRDEILNTRKEISAEYLGLSIDKKTVLVLGGSQGAAVINETIIKSLPELDKFDDHLQIIHCTGDNDFDYIKNAYNQSKIKAYVCPFLSKIEFAYSLADIVVSRAGAGTISEITAVGLPAVLIPYPFAADNHQYYNALELSNKGAACLIEQKDVSVAVIVKLIKELLTENEKREQMKTKSKGMGKPEAAGTIFKRIQNLIKKDISCNQCVKKDYLFLPSRIFTVNNID